MPVKDCTACISLARESAEQNWSDHTGREITTSADWDEIFTWADSYVAEAMSEPCSTHAGY